MGIVENGVVENEPAYNWFADDRHQEGRALGMMGNVDDGVADDRAADDRAIDNRSADDGAAHNECR